MIVSIRGAEHLRVFNDIQPSDTIGYVKTMIAEIEGLPVEPMKLYCCGQLLDDSTEVGTLESGELNLNIGLLGGKVHGSLARAGKVKGQTPKVEKQEKKKKRTGRAKRRFQYNRRFVNVIQGFGRKRGPNAAPST